MKRENETSKGNKKRKDEKETRKGNMKRKQGSKHSSLLYSCNHCNYKLQKAGKS